MELRSGVVLSEQHDLRIGDSWIPGTPDKPGTAGDQGARAAVGSWFQPAVGFSREAAGMRGFAETSVDLGGGGPESHVSSCCAGVVMRAQFMRGSIRGWQNNLYPAALMNAAAASSYASSIPIIIHGGFMHGREKSGSESVLNGRVCLLDNDQPTATACGTLVPPFTPMTPEKNQLAQDDGHPGSGSSVDAEGEDVAIVSPSFVTEGKGPIHLCFDKGTLEPADFVSLAPPSHMQENETEGEAEKQAIDLNKTLRQKAQRKKHRPKVVQEGKKPTNPKSPVPPPATPKTGISGENVSGKRKYVRRKGQNSPLETPSSVVAGENLSGKRAYVRRKGQNSPLETPSSALAGENASGMRKYVRRKGQNSPLETPSSAVARENIAIDMEKSTSSAKRRLNFSAEDDKAKEPFQGTRKISQEQVVSVPGNNASYNTGKGHSGVMSADISNTRQEVEVNSEAGIACILNHSNDQSSDIYLNSLDMPSLHLRPSRKELIRQNLKKLASLRHRQQLQRYGGITQFETQTDHQLTPECLATSRSSTSTSNLWSTDESMGRNEWRMNNDLFIDDNQLYNVNVVQADCNYEKTCNHHDTYGSGKCLGDGNYRHPPFAKIEKRRIEKGHSELMFNEGPSFADAQRLLELEALHAMEGSPAFGRIEEVKTLKSLESPIRACNLPFLRDNVEHKKLPTTRRNLKQKEKSYENDIIQEPLGLAEHSSADTQPRGKRCTKKEGKTQVFSVMLNHVDTQQQDFGMYTKRQKSGGSVSSSTSNSEPKNLPLIIASPFQECDTIRCSQENHNASYFTGDLLMLSHESTAHCPIDDIVQKMKSLNINEDQVNSTIQEQTALVPYGAHGMIVPFEDQFYPPKKFRHRAKIVLDEETNRVWKLLMGKESNRVEGTEADKEKWWEEERLVFQGRADSFIARMHLVQGDRRFSPWKGSVLDSVIGVFLTQNVSDHLSSSAFMSLAARFPPSREKNGEANISAEQHASCTEDHVVLERYSNKQDCDRNLEVFYGAEQVEEKEMDPSGCNTGDEMFSYSKVNDFSDIPLIITEDRKITKENAAKPLECTHSSPNSVASYRNSSGGPIPAVDQIGTSSETNSEAEYQITGNQCSLESRISFMELLELAGSNIFPELYACGNVKSSETNSFGTSSTTYQKHVESLGKEGLYFPSPIASGINPTIETENSAFRGGASTNTTEVSNHKSSILTIQASSSGDWQAFTGTLAAQSLPGSSTKDIYGKHSYYHEEISSITSESLTSSNHHNCSGLQDDTSTEILLNKRSFNSTSTNIQIASEASSQTESCKSHQFCSGSSIKDTSDVEKGKGIADKGVESNSTIEISSFSRDPTGAADSAPRRRGKLETEKKPFDWDSLRRQACQSGARREGNSDTMDSLDWEAVRDASVNEVANTIRERGMNNKLAERIKEFLDRLVEQHGSIDLEWLRDVPPDKAKDYLLSVKGLGLKSVECVRLLTLHHLAFPVDTNVGRICVRLGWVPLQPLPESLQLHLLELYPMLETIQKYLWPRLCTLDQRTLYELHYQMITFGKVFCTKSKPNCNACPMRGECKHFASAFASARLALPGPEEKSLVTSSLEQIHKAFTNPNALPQLEVNSFSQDAHAQKNCEPIIEEPATPEPEDSHIPDIEDAFYEDGDEIPTIELNINEFAQNLQSYMKQNDMELQHVDLSKALVAISPAAASIPVPKLKNISRLRTEHQVYELPDSHPLLEGLDQREAHDPCPYLLAIWTPGETAQSTEPPESCCSAQGVGNLCDKSTCFSCNSVREAQSQTVRGTILIPCRTAMRGSFPLNGTYFQVNEVFADHESSLKPIDVPRELIWNLRRRTVYFGTSIPTIFRGLAIEDIQSCFWRGFVCVRGFDRKTRGPRPLMARLHFPASKANRNKTLATKKD